MTYSTAMVDVTAFRRRDLAPGEFRRAVFGTFFVGVGSIAAVGAVIGCVTVAAACIVAGLHAANSHSHLALKRPFTLGARALTRLETATQDERERARDMARETARHIARDMSSAVEISAAVRALAPSASVNVVKLMLFKAPATRVTAAPQAATQQVASSMPLPMRRPLAAPQLQAVREQATQQAAHENVRLASAYAPEATSSVPAQTASFGSALQRLFAPQAAREPSPLLAAVDNHTAIYDIDAHMVYLPDGERMEAHSGLGQWIDDPGHINMKARGATPPNVYNLTMREGLFHGVEALRLTPVGDNSMYGRDGILAHPYMLGPSGQSFGCVSFKDYQAFLQAFKRGEVNRIVVVPHLGSKPTFRASSDGGNRYAFN